MASDRYMNRIFTSNNGIQCNDNVSNHLRLTQKVACTRNLRSSNRGSLIITN